MFFAWDTQGQGSLSLQDVVLGLDRVMSAGLMESIEWFFELVCRLQMEIVRKFEVLMFGTA